MTYLEHPSWNQSVWRACERTRQDAACYSVWWDGVSIFVRASEAAGPQGAKLICITHVWDDSTIQVLFTGGRAEWVKL